jgi:hypothetical protein
LAAAAVAADARPAAAGRACRLGGQSQTFDLLVHLVGGAVAEFKNIAAGEAERLVAYLQRVRIRVSRSGLHAGLQIGLQIGLQMGLHMVCKG